MRIILLLVFMVVTLGSTMSVHAGDVSSEYLVPFGYIDSDDPTIIATANKLTEHLNSDTEKAIALHDYVRDEILFGFTGDFYKQKASEVLRSKIGYCNTKGTLFVALLRASGIPARQVFVNIKAELLSGIISPGARYVDHSYAEVFLDNRWVKTDSYIVDKMLFEKAKRKLVQENKIIGYGIHLYGTSDWNGVSDSFSQFKNEGSYPDLSSKNYGVQRDVSDFYKNIERANNKQSLLGNIIFRLFVSEANNNIKKIRNS